MHPRNDCRRARSTCRRTPAPGRLRSFAVYVLLAFMGRTLVRQTSFVADGQDYMVVCMEDTEPPLQAVLGRLTPSEREVVALVAEGLRSQEIAVRRRRSVRTIENQLAAIFHKLKVSSRAELTARLSDST